MNRKKLVAALLTAGCVLTAMPVPAEEVPTAETVSAEEIAPAAEEVAAEAADVSSAQNAQRLDTYYTLALNAINSEDYDTANKYLNICFAYCKPDTDPELYADLLLKRACIDLIQGDADLSLLELQAAVDVKPDLADAYLIRTQIHTAYGEFDEAIENLEKYIELTEESSLYETVAQLYEANGNMEMAEEAYRKFAESTDLGEDAAGYQSGYYRMESGKYEEAIGLFEDYTEDETFGAGALFNIAICYMNLGDYEKAAENFSACEAKEGIFSGLYYNRGISYMMTGEWEAAAADFEKSVETEPFVNDSLYNLGICDVQMEEYESAIEVFTELIGDGEEEPEDVTAEEGEAETESGTEAPEEETAEEETESGAQTSGTLSDEYVGAYYYRAVCYGAIGELEKALADYTVCIDRGYDLAESYYQRAQVYEALGDTENQSSDLQNSLRYSR